MKVVVTGAAGYIGLGVARAFRQAGHQVWGIIRSEKKGSLVAQSGVIPFVADLREIKEYDHLLKECSVWVHCAFENSPEGVALDSFLIDGYLAKAANLPKTIIYTSGIRVYGNNSDSLLDENTPLQPLEMVRWRPLHEKKLLEAENPLLKTVVIRPGNIYGGSGGLTAALFAQAEKGEILLVGAGNNYWPMVHLEDLAGAFVLVAEKMCSHQVFNIVDNSLVTQKEVIEGIAAITGARVKRVDLEEAKPLLGKLAEGLATGGRISNERAKKLLGWQPKYPGFLCDLPRYYQEYLQ